MSKVPDTLSVERLITAEASAVFDLLADPSRHHELDGSGTLVKLKTPAGRLKLGDTFGMSMRRGLPYSMVNTVITFEPNSEIAWQTHAPGFLRSLVGGRTWRYEIQSAEVGVLVRETWDISKEAPLTKPFARSMADSTRRSMTETLERIQKTLGK